MGLFVMPVKLVVGLIIIVFVVLELSPAFATLSFDRRKSGNVSFSDQFPAVSVAPVVGSKLNELRLYVDNCSVEAFANGGRSVMTNLVFPSEPYNSISVKCDGKKKSASLVVYPLNK